MATREELREALDDYVRQANGNERMRRLLKGWNCVIQVQAEDTGVAFTLTIRNGELVGVEDGLQGIPDLVVRRSSEDLTSILWGDANPASNYMQGAIKVQGSQDDNMRLDAMAMLIYLKE
jgi:putative sterol carrier protein